MCFSFLSLALSSSRKHISLHCFNTLNCVCVCVCVQLSVTEVFSSFTLSSETIYMLLYNEAEASWKDGWRILTENSLTTPCDVSS